MTARTSNRFFNLPQEIQNYIFDYARDDTKKKIFNEDFNLYFKLYKEIKNIFTRPYKIINIKNEFENDNKNFIITLNNYVMKFEDNPEDENELILIKEDKTKYNKKYYAYIKTDDELEEEINNYLYENIIFINNDITDYERCLKNEYYNKNDWTQGIKASIKKKIKMHIENEEHNKIYNMLDLETFKHNYFRFNSTSDLLNYYTIEEIKILEKGELPNTKKLTTYNLLISEY